MRSLFTLVALLVAAQAAARGLPLNVELVGCVLPAPACSATRDVLTLNEHDRKLSFAVDTLHLRSTTRATSSQVLSEMKLYPLRVHGPDELVKRLTAGAHLRVRAALRLGNRYLMLTSVESLAH